MNRIFNLRTYLSVIFIVVFLASCATPPKTVTVKPVVTKEKPSKQVTLNNAEIALQKAQLEWVQNRDINQRNTLLLAAAQDFQTGGECGRSDIIVANIEPFLENPVQQQYSSLLKAECALIEYYSSGLPAELIQTPIDTMLTWLTPITDEQFIARKEVVIAHLAALHERWDLATNVLSQQLNADSPLNQSTLNQSALDNSLLSQGYSGERVSGSGAWSQNTISEQSDAQAGAQSKEHILWTWFLKASKATQRSLAGSTPFMDAYLSLANILDDENLSDASRQQAILFWQQQNPNHPLAISLPTDVQAYVQQKLKEVRNIAVLLPLSGRVQVQGDAIKQGILAAYFAKLEDINKNNPGQAIPNIQFLDTGSNRDSFVSDKITPEGLMEFDIVIGPLLREHVSLVRAFNLPDSMLVYLNRVSRGTSQSNASDTASDAVLSMLDVEFTGLGTSTNANDSEEAEMSLDDMLIAEAALAANGVSLDNSPGNPTHNASASTAAANDATNTTAKVYFALAPEDEATQLANLMKARGVRTPIIISNGSSLSRRMISTFNQQWIALNGIDNITTPKIVTFSDNKGLRIGITAALDVLQSQRRIRQMSNLTTEEVHSVTRNRRDVDAFVVFALPQQVELLNPIIEASISLFTDRTVPVFATSYSYQHQLTNNSIRDLRNLVFVDMPFLMPEQRNSPLAQEVDALWNKPPSSFLRLFAFGYDAFQFSEQMQQLAYFSHTHLKGLSGELTVNSQRQVTRSLPSAVIENDSITQLNGL